MLNPSEEMVCTEMPISCRTSATFLLDTSCFQHAEDVKADDNGSFRNQGRKMEVVEIDEEGEASKLEENPSALKPGQFKLSRTYWVHSSNSSFKRRLTELEDSDGDKWPIVILQYQYSGDPADIKLEPHKHAKKSSKPFYVTARSTKEKIAEKVKTALGPSSIYDELYEDGGGVMKKAASSLVPRGIAQVKYERSKLRKQHSKDTLAELIYKCKQSKGEFVHAVQISPAVRVVLATDSQLEDVVKFCCKPERFSVFGIDVTYDIGDFFVTTTTYRHLMLVDRETGSHPTFPGPLMIHTSETSSTFHYFSSTLKELNREVENILFVGSDRQKSIENGLSEQLPIVNFLSCKRHVEDNIKRKMALININDETKSDILADIFGKRRTKEKGLIDCESNEEFDAKLLSLMDKWNGAEKKCTRCDEAKFHTYFLAHIASDMKAKMLLPVRRSAGLGDKFYYNNCPESMNSSLKKEVQKQKQYSNPGEPSKCSYSEFIDIAHTFVGKYRRNAHRAVTGDGPYMLAPAFKHLEVSQETWRVLSQRERVAKIAAVDQAGAKAYSISNASASVSKEIQPDETTSQPQRSPCLPDFECSGLPHMLKGTWNNAETILRKGGVTKVSAAASTFAVISLTNPAQPHIVNNDNEKVKCNCEGFKDREICAHSLAVGHVEHILPSIVSSWNPNLASLMKSSIPKNSGRKPGPRRFRVSRKADERDVSGCEDRVHGVDPFPAPEPYHLRWLEGSRITTCYGCGNRFRTSMHDAVPPEPYDVVLSRKQIRAYTPKGSSGIRFTAKAENVYYHLKKSCVIRKSSDAVNEKSLIISNSDRDKMKISHKVMLRKEFGVRV